MTIDGIILNSIKTELQDKLLGGRIQKINQINKNLVLITVYAKKTFRLLISIDSQKPRVHLTKQDFTNPQTPTNFTMVLRKHLLNGRILEIKQNGLDRTLTIVVQARDEIGLDSKKQLIIDLMGRHSNLVLLDEKNKVIEALKRVSHDMSRVRAVYPGATFSNLTSDKVDITEDLISLYDQTIAEKLAVFKIFYSFYDGFSPTIGREIAYLANIDPSRSFGSLTENEVEDLNKAFISIAKRILNKEYKPNQIILDNQLYAYYCFELEHLGSDRRYFDSISDAIDSYYLVDASDDALNQSKNSLINNVGKNYQKLSSKIEKMTKDLQLAKDYDSLRIEAELLSSSQDKFSRGVKEVELYNYYNNQQQKVSLDERKDLWQNIEHKYKQAKRLKRTYQHLNHEIPKHNQELGYLQQIKKQIKESTSMEELYEIRKELYQGKYIKSLGRLKKKERSKPSKPLRFDSIDGSIIYVGKNNTQNEQITLREAHKEDYFFHIKDLPGAHVIVKTNQTDINEDDILRAGYLAAKHSSLSDETYVDVDYTKRKYVSKPKQAKPGMVIYTNFKTIRVDLSQKPEGLVQLN